MGQTPPKYFLPSSPYGSSPAINAVNPSQPAAMNPQSPLLPPAFSDPGTMGANPTQAMQPKTSNPVYSQLMKGLFGTILLILLCPALRATTTVTGTIKNLGTQNVTSGTYVRFWLRGCGGYIPRVNGTAVIAPSQGGVYFFDFIANSSGQVSGTLYSTRDVTGLLGGDIECGGSHTRMWYGMQIFVNGKGGSEMSVHALDTTTMDISTVQPITSTPHFDILGIEEP